MTFGRIDEVSDSADHIRDFAVRTLAPANLLFLRGILQDLIELENHVTSPDDAPELHQVILLAQKIYQIVDWSRLPPDLQEYPAPRYNRQGIALNSYNAHGLSDLPVWPMLQVQHPNPALAAQYRRFVARMASLLLRYSEKFSNPSDYERWLNNPDEEHPLGRHLSAARNASAAIRYLPLEASASRLSEFLELTDVSGLEHAIGKTLRMELSNTNFYRRLSALNCLISYLGGDKPPRRRCRRRVIQGKQPIRENDNCLRVLLFMQPDDDIDPSEAGIEPLPVSLMFIEPEDDEDLSVSDAGSSKAQQRKRQNTSYQTSHVARTNQPLPFSLGYLQPHQREVIHNWLRQSDASLPLKRMIAGIILLGQSLGVMNEARYSRSDVPLQSSVEILVDVGCWRIRPQIPEVNEVETGFVLQIQESLMLPIAEDLKALLLSGDTEAGAMLNGGMYIEDVQLRRQLRSLSNNLRPSLLHQWLGRQLFLCHKSHNASALLSPYGAPHLVTLSHYEHPLVSDLIDQYVAALRAGGFRIIESDILAAKHGIDPELAQARTGASNASDPEALRSWVISMLDQLENMPLVTAEDRCTYSNCFTRFCFLMTASTTLLRGVTNPDIRIIDRKRHLVIISDKDRGKNGTMDRLVELTRDGLIQIDNMQQHRHALMATPGMPPDITNVQWPILTLTEKAGQNSRRISLKPAKTTELVGLTPAFPGPLNAFRKFLHTRLGELGLPGQHLDVLSGHWQPGQEGYSQYSALVPRLLMESVRPLLKQIQDELGFRPHRSRLV